MRNARYMAVSTPAPMESTRTMPTIGCHAGVSASRGAAASPAKESSSRMPAPANWCTQPLNDVMSAPLSVGKTAARIRHSDHTPNSTVGRPDMCAPAHVIPASTARAATASAIAADVNGALPPSMNT